MERYWVANGILASNECGGLVKYDDAQRALDAERERARVATQLIIETIGSSGGPEDLEEALGRMTAKLATLQAQLEALRRERDEARHSRDVFKSQMIAHMNDRDSYAEDLTTLQAQAKQLDRTLADVYQQRDGLQAQLRRVEGERDHAKKMEAVQKEVADNQTWHVQKLKDWRDTVTLALQRPGGARFEDVPGHIKTLVREREAHAQDVDELIDCCINDVLVTHATPGGKPHDPDPQIRPLRDKIAGSLVELQALRQLVEAHAKQLTELTIIPIGCSREQELRWAQSIKDLRATLAAQDAPQPAPNERVEYARLELAALFSTPGAPTLEQAKLVCENKNPADAQCILNAYEALREAAQDAGKAVSSG